MLTESCVMFFSPSRAVVRAILRDEYLTSAVRSKEGPPLVLGLKFNSSEPYPSSERERKFRLRLFTCSIKHTIRQFHVVVVHKQQNNVQKSVMHVRSCCFS